MTQDTNGPRPHGIILAFDFGLRRIGIAAGNSVTQSATALTTLTSRNQQPPWAEIDRLVAEWAPVLLVVGQPEARSDASMARQATAFAVALHKRYGLRVARVDEMLTSAAARAELSAERQAGQRKRRINKELIDSHAARLIAQQYLSSH